MFDGYRKNATKLGITKANINFLSKCTKHQLIPKGFFSKDRLNTRRSAQLETSFAKTRMREQLNHLHAKAFNLEFQLANNWQPIPQDIQQDLFELRDAAYHKKKEAQSQKFRSLLRKQKHISSMQYKTDVVLNSQTLK
jgi:hypothetical protein